jgi:large subunit ribosomal protein L7/L12
MGIFGGSAQDDVDLRELKDRVSRLEATVASLQGQLAALGSGPAPAVSAPPADLAWLAEVRRLKDSGKLIHAIKAYREHTGVGLKEAKDAVEGMV